MTSTNQDDIRARNVRTVRTFYRLQEAMDFERWLELWAEEAGQDIPYAPEGFPTTVRGKANLEGLYRPLFEGFAEIHIQDLRVDPLNDPNRVLVRWHTHGPLKNGGLYENDLVGVFEFGEDGRITHLTEYLNPQKVNIHP
ncbi:nuclear transport factor 2 family protein [Streptomyces hoynatensis]|uniref:nuclear transport factor 2 family protein n=1 Tax=Streptomyces hoynatensis TaxID=1141874 RepID=UPI001319DB54|nr:nuclear transport factor 2 family protein [Streptomyces hoynatensis]